MREQQFIQAAFYKLDDKSKHEYRVQLNASINVVRLLLNQGFAFRGHDESESSLNKANGYLRYVDKMGFVMEAFIGLVHIKDTSDLSLKKTIVDVLAHHSLTLSYVRELILLISNILNVLGASFKRVDNFRESQKKHL
ncbi:hypothetical protein R3W88_009399 [Solanum pinnatisectum]|uniref:DUF4371 domain-containing protein n=1 Tax=Solanum pinnatisectum TaxID=50273 RepID=A0AAV9MBH7_9SOLN|nr:hypothetical protein R3W88_009399 [Solanum pinnatisectum]